MAKKKEHRPSKFGVIKGEKVIEGFRCCTQSRWFHTREGRDKALAQHIKE